MNLTRMELAAIVLTLVIGFLILLWLMLDWSYNRGRTDLYAMLLQLRATADSTLKWCPIPGSR